MRNLSILEQKTIVGGAYHVFLMKYGQFIREYSFDTEWEANRYVDQINNDPDYGINSGNWDGYHAYLRGEY